MTKDTLDWLLRAHLVLSLIIIMLLSCRARWLAGLAPTHTFRHAQYDIRYHTGTIPYRSVVLAWTYTDYSNEQYRTQTFNELQKYVHIHKNTFDMSFMIIYGFVGKSLKIYWKNLYSSNIYNDRRHRQQSHTIATSWEKTCSPFCSLKSLPLVNEQVLLRTCVIGLSGTSF